MNNKLAILGGFGLMMLILAISLQVAARSRSTQNQLVNTSSIETGPDITGTNTLATSWPLYQDPYNAYELKIPPSWSSLTHTSNIETTKAFTLLDEARLEINVIKTKASNLSSYLESLDAQRSALWQGQPSRVVGSLTPLRIGNYDGFERTELISASGLELIVSYIMVDDDVFSFTLIPTGTHNSVVNKELIKNYKLALQTFKITNIPDRLGEWKTYQSQKIETLSYPTYQISFPATWAINEQKADTSQNLIISRNGYKIILSQAAVGGAVCLFKDSPPFQGSSGDLRSKDYSEYQTEDNYILRRYFKGNEGDNSIFLFCGKNQEDTYFQTPLIVGGLNFSVPAKYDPAVIKEMDRIVQTLITTNKEETQ